MALPKLSQPLFDAEVPSTKQKIKFRPMLVKEEKILLMAKETSERTELLNSILQVTTNCVQDKLDVSKLSLSDVEYIFIKIRSQSIGGKVKMAFQDQEDQKRYDFEIDLSEVKVTDGPKTNKFELAPDVQMTMKLPPATLYSKSEFLNAKDSEVFELLMQNCVERIYQGDKVHIWQDYTTEERKEFIETLPAKVFTDLNEYFSSVPTLHYEIKYKNSAGTERTITLRTLEDFFTFY